MKKIFFILISCSLIFSNCQKENKVEKANIFTAYEEFPKLLDRHDNLKLGKEWEDVMRNYSKCREDIIHNHHPIEAKLNLADIFIQEARVTGEHPYYYSNAQSLLKSVLENQDLNNEHKFRALSSLSSVTLSLHQFKEAIEFAEQAIALNPYNAGIYGALVDGNVELGHYVEAVKYADKMVNIRPDIRSYSRVSYLREIYGHVDESIEAMKMAIGAAQIGREDRAWAMNTLAHIYINYNQWGEAQNVVENILQERPNFPFALATKAEIEAHHGNEKFAIELLTEAENSIPEVAFAIQKAKLFKKLHELDMYKKSCSAILAMMKEDTEKGHNMDLEYAHVYMDLFEDYDQALLYALKEFERRPENIDVNRTLAKIYNMKNNIIKANEHLVRASLTGSKQPELSEIRKSLKS